MSTVTVAKKDFKAARRSKMLWAAAIVLGLIAAFVGYVSGGASGADVEQVRALFRVLTLLLAVLLPIVALVASYLAIAGEREGGGIKFLLSLPNTRRSVFVGKLLSRNGIVAGGVAFMYVAAISTALTRHGAFPAGMIFGTLLITLVYGSTFVSIALAMSSAAASRSRAIAGAFGTYFVLVILYVFPAVSFGNIARWVHTTLLGASPNPDLYNAVQYTSPYLAYRKAVNLALPAEMRHIVFYSSLPDDISYGSPEANEVLPVYLQDGFSLVVLAFWLVVPLLIGYALFERADLE
ncbi:ABC transporter permease [Halosimplex litoreum]|uniref:ABC transporter permease n=1 Tax=Halosimplex litoreum TaxID=1198301 RepID=A0A7T3KTY7_9EURY|nr:ABC transporter permease subunit [Halosimplex litoreum]QPV61423.1 ABC transporter permease [Halosimplex litoreum]